MCWLYWFLLNDPILYLFVCSYCFEETANIADVWKFYCSTELLCILNDLSIKWRYMLLHRWLQVGIFCIWLNHCVVFWIWYPFSFILWIRYFSVFILNENLSRKLINKWIKSRGNNQNLDLELIFLIQEKKTFVYGSYKAQVILLNYFLPNAKFFECIYISFGRKLTSPFV